MRLISLELKNYRQFKEVTVEFPDGLSGIIGLNGVGKTSLAEAIAWVLYGHEVVREKSKEGIKRDDAPAYGDCEAVLELELGGSFYRIQRALRGTNQVGDASIYVNEKPLATSVRETDKAIFALLKMDHKAFHVSFFAKQKELNALMGIRPGERKETITRMLRIDALNEVITLIRTDARDAKTKLSTLRLTLPDENILRAEEMAKKKDLASKEGELKNLKVNLQSLEDQRKNIAQAYEDQKRKYEKHHELKLAYTQKNEVLKAKQSEQKKLEKELSQILEEEKKAKEIQPQIIHLEEMETKIRKLERAKDLASRRLELERKRKKEEELLCDIQGKEKKIAQLQSVESELEKVDKMIKEIHGQIKSLHDRLTESQEEKDEKLKTFAKIKDLKRCPTCGQSLIGEHKKQVNEHFDKEIQQIEEKIKNLNTQKKELLPKKDNLEKDLKTKIEELNERRMELGGLSEKQKRIESLQKEIENDEKELAEIKGITYDPNLHEKLKKELPEKKKLFQEFLKLEAKSSKKEEIKDALNESKERAIQVSAELSRIKTEGEKLAFRKEEYENTAKVFEEINGQYEKEKEKVHQLELEQMSLKKDLERIQKEVEDYHQKKEIIESESKRSEKAVRLEEVMINFKENLISRIKPELAKSAGQLFTALTNGKYGELELNEDYEMFISDNGIKYPLVRFSGGEADLANLCLRLSISQLLSGSSELGGGFIILDEIFGSQDFMRKGAILQALQSLTKQFRQIFLITHVDEIKDSLEHIIEVTEDESGISQVKQY